jgi:Fe-S-cluster containining protein
MDDLLANYNNLVAKVNELCRRIESDCSDQLTCHAGCCDCCRHLTLSWVEAVALSTAVSRLPFLEAEEIRRKAATAPLDGPCPLLSDNICALYACRPIICRTHGLPILTSLNGKQSIDFCPLNFQGIESLPGTAAIDLERLNTLLESVNRLFINSVFDEQPEQERLTIAEALLLDIECPREEP